MKSFCPSPMPGAKQGLFHSSPEHVNAALDEFTRIPWRDSDRQRDSFPLPRLLPLLPIFFPQTRSSMPRKIRRFLEDSVTNTKSIYGQGSRAGLVRQRGQKEGKNWKVKRKARHEGALFTDLSSNGHSLDSKEWPMTDDIPPVTIYSVQVSPFAIAGEPLLPRRKRNWEF